MECGMKKMSKEQILVLFLVCTSATSIHGLLRTGTRRLPTTGASLARVAPQQKLYTTRVPTPLKTTSTRSWFTNTSRTVTDRLSAWKSQFLNWYTGTKPIPGVSQQKLALPQVSKELVVPVTSVVTTEPVKQPELPKKSEVVTSQPTSPVVSLSQDSESQAQIESEEILTKLRGENPWNYPKGVERSIDIIAMKSSLAKQINEFLNKNDVNVIENVFLQLIQPKKGSIFPGGTTEYFVLQKICANNKSLATKIFPLIIKHIDEIHSEFLLGAVLSQVSVPQIPEQFAQAERAQDKFIRLADAYVLLSYFGQKNIPNLFSKNAENLLVAIARVCNKITVFYSHYSDEQKKFYAQLVLNLTNFLAEESNNISYENLQKALKIIISERLKFGDLLNIRGLNLFVQMVLDSNPSLKNRFVDSNSMVKQLLIDCNKTITIQNGALSGLDGQSFLEVVFDLDSNYAQTPSYRHLIENYGKLHMLGYEDAASSPIFKNMVHNIMNKERESIGNYEVFYHGRRWSYGFLSQVYDMLYSQLKDKPLGNFSFTHFVEQMKEEGSEKFFADQEQMREKLLKEGNRFSETTRLPKGRKTASEKELQGFLNRQKLLFLNKFLFGNIDKISSSSIAYILGNFNQGQSEADFFTREIFNMFDYGDIYDMYAKDIDDLEQEYNKLSRYGELLQILVPKENVDKCVYYTTSGGPLVGSGDVKEILRYLDKYPKDKVEFALVNTYDKHGGLNPDSGIKVFSYNLVEPEKMAAFKEKEKQLFDKIREACRKKDAKEKLAAAEKE